MVNIKNEGHKVQKYLPMTNQRKWQVFLLTHMIAPAHCLLADNFLKWKPGIRNYKISAILQSSIG